LSHEFGNHLKSCGIVPQLTPAGTPQRNGVAERRNRTLLDSVRSMMSHTDLPVSFWGYALETAAHILNRAPSKSVKTTPFEEWHGTKPKLSHLKIWGCEAYVRKLQPDKLESKADKCIFVGYPKETCGYTFYNKSDSKTFVAKTGHFLEKEFLAKELSGRKIDLDEVTDQSLQLEETATEIVLEPSSTVGAEENGQNDIHNDHDIDDDHDENEEEPFMPRRSSRVRQPTEFYGQLVNAISADESDEPTSYKEAMEGPESEKWLEAMKSEIDSMYTNKVGLWWIFPRTARPSRINGFSRKRLTQTETYLSTKLDLSRRVSDKFKELTTRRRSLL